MRKGHGKEAKLSYSAHALMENRHGMLVDLRIAEASGTAERRLALEMIDDNLPGPGRVTLGADKGYALEGAKLLGGFKYRASGPDSTMGNKSSKGIDQLVLNRMFAEQPRKAIRAGFMKLAPSVGDAPPEL